MVPRKGNPWKGVTADGGMLGTNESQTKQTAPVRLHTLRVAMISKVNKVIHVFQQSKTFCTTVGISNGLQIHPEITNEAT